MSIHPLCMLLSALLAACSFHGFFSFVVVVVVVLLNCERINCKTIQFIQKYFIFCALLGESPTAMSMTTKTVEQSEKRVTTITKIVFSRADGIVMPVFPSLLTLDDVFFSFAVTAVFHCVSYYLFFIVAVVVVITSFAFFSPFFSPFFHFRFSFFLFIVAIVKNAMFEFIFALFYTIQM